MKSNIVKQFHAYGWDWYLVEDGRQSWISEPVKKRIEELEAENAKLKEELEAVGTAAYLYGRSDLKTENAKMRELLGNVGHTLFSLDVDYCGGCKADNINHPCPVYTVKGGECLYKTAMRELGVEV